MEKLKLADLINCVKMVHMLLRRFWWSGITSTTPPAVPVLMQSGACLSPVSWHWWATTLSASTGHEMWAAEVEFSILNLQNLILTNSLVLTLLSVLPCFPPATFWSASLSSNCSQEGSSLWWRLWWGVWVCLICCDVSGTVTVELFKVIVRVLFDNQDNKREHFIKRVSIKSS